MWSQPQALNVRVETRSKHTVRGRWENKKREKCEPVCVHCAGQIWFGLPCCAI